VMYGHLYARATWPSARVAYERSVAKVSAADPQVLRVAREVARKVFAELAGRLGEEEAASGFSTYPAEELERLLGDGSTWGVHEVMTALSQAIHHH
jgi:hypothetical protein